MDSDHVKSALKKTYFKPESPGSLGGVKRLRGSTGEALRDIKNWLSYQDVYTLHKPVRHRFPRRRTIVSSFKEQYQCDLIDVQKLKKDNDGYGFILTCIDVFSQMAYARPIKKQNQHQCYFCIKKCLRRGRSTQETTN